MPQKFEKKFVENVGRKKFVVEIDEKYVDQKNHQMVRHIMFFSGGKKTFATNNNFTPPPRYIIVRPLHLSSRTCWPMHYYYYSLILHARMLLETII